VTRAATALIDRALYFKTLVSRPNEFSFAVNVALRFSVQGQPAPRLEPSGDTPNIIAGYSGNSVLPGLEGVRIAGGGTAITFGGQSQPNEILGNGYFATIAGGYHNLVNYYAGVVGGGAVNSANAGFSIHLERPV